MINGLKPYPNMKDSGVPWLGEVPEHWGVLPNRAIFDEVKERDRPGADMLSVTITKGVIRQQALLEDSSKKDSSKLDRSAYKFVRPGDIAYNKMRAWQGAVGVSDYEGIVSPAYVVQRPRNGAASRYLHYMLRTPAFAKEADSMKADIVHGLRFTEDLEIERAVRAYVSFYNGTRLHSSLNYVPPATFERLT